MRGWISNWTSRFDDPLLRVGTTLMFLALGCAVVVLTYAFTGGSPDRADAAVRPLTKTATKIPEPLVRTDPGISPWVEKDIPPPKPEATPQPQAKDSDPPARTVTQPQTTEPETAKHPEPQKAQPKKQQAPAAQNAPRQANQQAPQQPVHQQASHYHLPPGAIMTLTVPALGIRNAPVANSTSESALDRGVVHLPDTSLPWSDTPERNVYLAGHRLGWPNTGSYRIFLRLNELTGGEKVILHGPDKAYTYKVTDNFIVGPKDNWVTGRVRDRDMVTLQTCTPIPTFQKRLIVRAERL